MKINYNTNSTFPSQVVSDAEKATWEYGTQVAQAIEQEWFNQGRTNGNRYLTTWNNYNRLRLYARGEQPVEKYKDELSINGDLSYLNLDWKPVPIISKFVDILVNGISNKNYEINAFAQDPQSLEKRTNYAEMLAQDIFARQTMEEIVNKLDASLFNTTIPESKLPADETELELHMQLSYKQSVEIAEEEVINQVLDSNRWELTKRRVNYDLVTCGIGACKTNFNLSNGITVDYVDPAYLIYSYTEDPNFEDIYYVGELKPVTLAEIAKQFPTLDGAEHHDGPVSTRSSWIDPSGLTGDGEKKISAKTIECIKAKGSGEGTGRMVGGSVGASVGSGLTSIPFVGWVLAGAASMIGMNEGAELGGNIAERFTDACVEEVD